MVLPRLATSLVLLASAVSNHPWYASAASWSSWTSQATTTNNKNDDNDDLQQFVSPLTNRELRAQVVAQSWPTTAQNVYCEAMAYFEEPDRTEFLQQLASIVLQEEEEESEAELNETLYERANRLALQAAESLLADTSLLQFHLAMRAASPFCELHRGLARQQYKSRNNQQQPNNETAAPQVMAVVYPTQQMLFSLEELHVVDWESLVRDSKSIASATADLVLPKELVQGKKNASVFVVLYANLGTTDFARTYTWLQQQSANISFVVRHLGAIDYEEDSSVAEPTVLQGYGVRLDIRNVEYKVFDDRHASATGDERSSFVNVSDQSITPPLDYLAGVNCNAAWLADRVKNKRELEAHLWKRHDQRQVQSQIIPPVWQRRQLPLQMTTVIAASSNPLQTLEELTQNLPSLASTLVHVKINETVLEMATKLQEASAIQAGKLYINGRAIRFDRPSFNIFELLDLMKEEEKALSELQQELGPYLTQEQLVAVQDAWIMGEEFMRSKADSESDEEANDQVGGKDTTADKGYRVDVARGGKKAILYLNDVEKDKMYIQWPRSVKKMLMGLQYGYVAASFTSRFTIWSLTTVLVRHSVQIPTHGSPQSVYCLDDCRSC